MAAAAAYRMTKISGMQTSTTAQLSFFLRYNNQEPPAQHSNITGYIQIGNVSARVAWSLSDPGASKANNDVYAMNGQGSSVASAITIKTIYSVLPFTIPLLVYMKSVYIYYSLGPVNDPMTNPLLHRTEA